MYFRRYFPSKGLSIHGPKIILSFILSYLDKNLPIILSYLDNCKDFGKIILSYLDNLYENLIIILSYLDNRNFSHYLFILFEKIRIISNKIVLLLGTPLGSCMMQLLTKIKSYTSFFYKKLSLKFLENLRTI